MRRDSNLPPQSITGFTLIELLVVLAILGLLIGLVGPQIMRQFSGAQSDIAKLQIEDFGATLDIFYLENGRYPTTSEGLEALIKKPGNLPAWNGPYLKKNSIPLDPWSNAYHYEAPGQHGQFDLYSYGADGVPGGEGDDADIANWE